MPSDYKLVEVVSNSYLENLIESSFKSLNKKTREFSIREIYIVAKCVFQKLPSVISESFSFTDIADYIISEERYLNITIHGNEALKLRPASSSVSSRMRFDFQKMVPSS